MGSGGDLCYDLHIWEKKEDFQGEVNVNVWIGVGLGFWGLTSFLLPLYRLFSVMLLPNIQGLSLSNSTAASSDDTRWPCSHQVTLLVATWMHALAHPSVCSSFIHYLYIEHLDSEPGSANTKANKTQPAPGEASSPGQWSYTCYAMAPWMEDLSVYRLSSWVHPLLPSLPERRAEDQWVRALLFKKTFNLF